MKFTILVAILLSTNFLFAQNGPIEFDKIVSEYVLALWENNGTVSASEFDVDELSQLKLFFLELSKQQNQIASKRFIENPSNNTLVGTYLHQKLKWNSFNGPHVGIKKLKNNKVVQKELKALPSRYELLAHYYSNIFIDVLNKQKPMNLGDVNIELSKLGLKNDTEKAILFLSAMRYVGGQVSSYSLTRFPDNCFRAKEYVENMPTFNGKPFYEFELPKFDDFKIEVDKRYPKMSFKGRYLPEFENAKNGYEKCQLPDKD